MELIVAAGLIPFKIPSLPNIGQDLRRIGDYMQLGRQWRFVLLRRCPFLWVLAGRVLLQTPVATSKYRPLSKQLTAAQNFPGTTPGCPRTPRSAISVLDATW
ncbi:hypothetical protein [Zobellella sp. DQSA1]|uniref:hypothetical protein n=1 Tax=Zobellella sp. DQSA1 TaxID=3342386 RepID=UPI0035C072A5